MIKIDHLDVVRDHGFSLNNIDLIIPDGKMYGLVGPNGSGKSTLIETVCNKIHPDSGKISIDGKNISEYKIKELAKTISVMFQKSEISDFEIEDVVLAGRTPYKNIFEQFNSEDEEKAISAILYASPLALKTNNHTKLTALQNIIINTILEPNYEEYKIQMFLRFVDDFSELHILLLKFLNEPGLFYKPKDTCFTYSIASYSLESLFLKQYKGFDSSSVKSALNYLSTNYLIDCEITTFSTVMTTDALLISRTTNLGKDFIEFIISK